MEIQPIPVGALAANCYWVGNEPGILVDPGAEPEKILAALGKRVPEAIVLTHAHADHLGAAGPLAERFGVGIYLHTGDLFLYQAAPEMGSYLGMKIAPLPEPAGFLTEGDAVPGIPGAQILAFPGHSPGGIGLYHPEEGFLIAGDLIFRGSIGRYDLPGASESAIFASLARLRALPPQTRIYPGHGPATTLARELAENPFLRS